jgi:hypothetical protein
MLTYATACDVLFCTAFVASLAVIGVTLWEHRERVLQVCQQGLNKALHVISDTPNNF